MQSLRPRSSTRCGGPSIGWGSPSKKTVHADEQRRPDVATAGRPVADVSTAPPRASSMCFWECGVTTDLRRRYGPQPERHPRPGSHSAALGDSHGRAGRYASMASASRPCSMDRSTRRCFSPTSSRSSVPTLRPGDVVVLDKSRRPTRSQRSARPSKRRRASPLPPALQPGFPIRSNSPWQN